MSRPFLVPILLVAASAALAGCAGCTDFPAHAHVGFTFDGTDQELRAELRELGWRVVDAENALRFQIFQTTNGTEYGAVVHYGGLDPAGNVSVSNLEGSLAGESTAEEARAHLAPVVEPIAARFGAEAEYARGSRHCGDV